MPYDLTDARIDKRLRSPKRKRDSYTLAPEHVSRTLKQLIETRKKHGRRKYNRLKPNTKQS